MGLWAILRTAGPRTLSLADSLVAHRYTAWTPVVIKHRRRIAGRRGAVEHPVPLMPTFVFVAASQLPDLAPMARSILSPHPSFSVFRWDGRIPLIAEGEVERLREVERKLAPKPKPVIAKPFNPGERVKMTSGSFIGLEGVVEQSDGRHTLLCFNDRMRVQIATSILRPNDICGAQHAA